jgi:hypothetical protein
MVTHAYATNNEIAIAAAVRERSGLASGVSLVPKPRQPAVGYAHYGGGQLAISNPAQLNEK